MEFELNLLENSYDYIRESLGYYKKIGYDETHDPDRDSIDEKVKWKTTFLLLVQAMELLIKENLSRINPILIYDNIDMAISENSKTITFKKSLDRLINLKSNLMRDEDIQFLMRCGNIRNECVHYKVKLNSIEIKKKYCKLFELYIKLHSKFFNKKYINEKYKWQIKQILEYSISFDVFRGNEYTAKTLKQVKEELKKGQISCLVYNRKEAYERIRYGYEPYLLDKIIEDRAYAGTNYFYNLKYCGNCSAKYGEYHMLECDCEICPKCGKQLVTCECFNDYCDMEYANKKFKENIVEFDKK